MKFIIILFALIYSTISFGNEKDYTIDRLDWEKQLNKNSTVSVENLYGNVYIKKAYNNSFVIHAVNQNHTSNKVKAKFIIDEDKGNISIKVAFDKDEAILQERSDISIIMPRDIHLDLTMHSNELTAKKIMNPITIKAESTQIYLTTKSEFNVLSKLGDVFVKILDNSTPQKSKAQSHRGNITLQYLVDKPHISVVSGKTVVSNSAELLLSKKKEKRKIMFNESSSPFNITIQNDAGNVILMDKNIK